MIRIFLCVLVLSVAVINSTNLFASNLPSQHESVRLMLAIEASVKESNWNKAHTQLKALESLELALDEDFFYYNGLVNTKLNQILDAEKSLEHYVVSAGKDGKYYVEALQLITFLDEQQRAVAKDNSVEASVTSPAPIISSEQRDGYIKSLQALYLTDDPIKALEMQINSLLSAHAYTGSRVKKSDVRSGINYSLSVIDNHVSLQEKKYEAGFPSLQASKLDVHGLDPFLRYECTKREFACNIYHPANTHLPWITIDYDDMVASELVEALTKLIQQLQAR